MDGWDGGSAWTDIDILGISEIWNVIEDAIEEQCKVEDAKRRRAASARRRGKDGAREPHTAS
jgi:hypothetical protein